MIDLIISMLEYTISGNDVQQQQLVGTSSNSLGQAAKDIEVQVGIATNSLSKRTPQRTRRDVAVAEVGISYMFYMGY